MSSLILPGGEVHPAILDLILESRGVSFNAHNVLGVNNHLQSEWLKAGPGTYRAEIEGRMLNKSERELFGLLGHLDEIAITMELVTSRRGVVVLGGTAKAIWRRLRFALRALVWPGDIKMIGSARPIIEKLEGRETFPAMVAEVGDGLSPLWREPEKLGYEPGFWPVNEAEMMEFIFCLATGQEGVGQTFCAPLNEQGKADTASSVRAWAEKVSEGERFVIVSSQPFCWGQLLAVQEAAPHLRFGVCGPAAPTNLPAATFYDNAAKQFYAECKALGVLI